MTHRGMWSYLMFKAALCTQVEPRPSPRVTALSSRFTFRCLFASAFEYFSASASDSATTRRNRLTKQAPETTSTSQNTEKSLLIHGIYGNVSRIIHTQRVPHYHFCDISTFPARVLGVVWYRSEDEQGSLGSFGAFALLIIDGAS